MDTIIYRREISVCRQKYCSPSPYFSVQMCYKCEYNINRTAGKVGWNPFYTNCIYSCLALYWNDEYISIAYCYICVCVSVCVYYVPNFADGNNILTLWQPVCQKLNDGSTSMMRSRHLISNTNDSICGTIWTHHPRIYNLMETHSGSSPSVLKHPPGFLTHSYATIHWLTGSV